jgi:hypothetical protein
LVGAAPTHHLPQEGPGGRCALMLLGPGLLMSPSPFMSCRRENSTGQAGTRTAGPERKGCKISPHPRYGRDDFGG